LGGGGSVFGKLVKVECVDIGNISHGILFCCFQGDMTNAKRPHLQIIKPGMNVYDEISNDALSIRGFTEYKCNDYHLGKKLRET